MLVVYTLVFGMIHATPGNPWDTGDKPFPPQVLAIAGASGSGKTTLAAELARQLQAEGMVRSISPETVRRILRSHKLKPWRHHLWLSAKVPRSAQSAKAAGTENS